MLQSTQEEINEIREYFQWQAPDLEISFMQKVYSESVLGAQHDVWDIHTNNDRWWVITNPANLYSQEQFPNMDLVVTFHIGLCIRIPRTQRQKVDEQRIIPFGPVFKELSAATDALSQALNVSDYQAVGVRSREILLKFIAVVQDRLKWTDDPPKRADFRGWIEVICNRLLPSEANKERRKLLKTVLELAWTFSNWLTHANSVSWQDADFAIASVDHAINMATSRAGLENLDSPISGFSA